MSVNLSEEQRQAIAARPDMPVRALDPNTNVAYIIVTEELFERLRTAADEDFDIRDTYPLVRKVLQEDWDDPAMNVYDSASPDENRP